MTITLAHTAQDGTRTYRTGRGVDIAYAGTAAAVTNLLAECWQRDWQGYGSPSQTDGLFLMVAPSYRPEEIPLRPGDEGWLAMHADEIDAFAPA